MANQLEVICVEAKHLEVLRLVANPFEVKHFLRLLLDSVAFLKTGIVREVCLLTNLGQLKIHSRPTPMAKNCFSSMFNINRIMTMKTNNNCIIRAIINTESLIVDIYACLVYSN